MIKDLLENVFAPEEARKISKQLTALVKENEQGSQKELTQIQKALKEIDLKIDKLIDAVVNGVLDNNMVKQKMDNLKQEKAQLEFQLHKLQFDSYDWVDENKVYDFLMKSKENLLSEDNLLKRKVIETFVDKIKVYPNRIDSNLKVSMLPNPDADRGIVGQTV